VIVLVQVKKLAKSAGKGKTRPGSNDQDVFFIPFSCCSPTRALSLTLNLGY